MKTIIRLVAATAAIGALACAAPAAAQYPRYGYGYGYAQRSNGYGGYTQLAVNQCAGAVQARLDGPRNAYGNPYGYSGARVLGISRVDARGYGGGVTVRGVATSGQYAYPYAPQLPLDLSWQCTTDYRGMVTGVTIEPVQSSYGYDTAPRAYEGDDYSRFGYVRY